MTVDDDRAVRVAAAFGAAIGAHAPEPAQRLRDLRSALDATSTLPPRLRELVRLRIAFHNQCRSCMSLRNADAVEDGLTETLVCALEQPAAAPDLTDAERAALRFADLFATDHLAIGDEVRSELSEHFEAGEIAVLGLLCAYYVGFGRLAATYALTEDVPDEFRMEQRPGPWSGPGLVIG